MRMLVIAAVVSACIHSATAPQLGENIELRYGASVVIPGDSVSVRFTEVTSDSRCPSGAQCVWAGEATVLFTVGANERVSLTLGVDSLKATAIVRSVQMTLVALKPYPAVHVSTARGAYIATLRFDRARN